MKKNTNRRINRRKVAIVMSIFLVLLITSLAVYQLIWEKPATINSGILIHERIFRNIKKSFGLSGSILMVL
ncbi:MAG: hypothetical protein ABR503_02460 [Chitinophagaceae bacterium]